MCVSLGIHLKYKKKKVNIMGKHLQMNYLNYHQVCSIDITWLMGSIYHKRGVYFSKIIRITMYFQLME